MTGFKNVLISAFCITSLTACSVGPDYQAPSFSFLSEWIKQDTVIHSTQAPVSTTWWESFNDPLLTNYINQAVQKNKDIEIAKANILKARAARSQTNASFWPSLGFTSSNGKSKTTDNISTRYDSSFDASWEIDIFGGNRRALEATTARLNQNITSYHDVMLSVLSETARNYYEIRGLQKQIAFTENNVQLLNKTKDVIQARLNVGESSEFDLSRAQGEYQLTKAKIPNLQADLKAKIYSLSILLGQTPEFVMNEMDIMKPLPAPADSVPVGLPSDLLRRRPDIKTAEYELKASIADIGTQTAELFPKFFITGNAGTNATLFSDIFSTATQTWGFGALMQWSIFNGGAIRAGIDIEEAETKAALASYEKTVLEALADVETALIRYAKEIETRKLLEQGVASRQKSVNLAKQLFEVGEQDYLAVLDAERELITSEDDLVVSETQSITKLISLYTALGGGWEAFQEND